MLKRRPDIPRCVEPGVDNPLGYRALYLYQGDRDTLYRIHGTKEPWTVGGTDPKRYAEAEKAGTRDALPSNHAPEFAPVPTPTLRTGVEPMLAAAAAWLAPPALDATAR